MDKKEWKIIETHHFEGDIFQSNAGLYGMNPFLFNPNNSNINKIYSLNNDMLRIKAQNNKNALLIDLLEIIGKYQIPSNNILLMLPSKSLRHINTHYKWETHNFKLLEIVGTEFKSTLIDYIDDYIKTHQSKNNIFEKLNFQKMIDVKISNEQITVTLPFGTITISGLEFESTHLLVQSNLDKKVTKAFEIVPYQTHHQLIMNYLCELIVAQCADIYLQFINNEKTYKD